MLSHRRGFPFDYSMCTMTVTVYHRKFLTCQIIHSVHLEYLRLLQTTGEYRHQPAFLFAGCARGATYRPGDKVVAGKGLAITDWHSLPALVAESVKTGIS